jgi:Zn-finger nucleic acid-binding protein
MAYLNLDAHCLNCQAELHRRTHPRGFLLSCHGCHSFAAHVGLLREVLPATMVGRLWSQARAATVRHGRKCPLCSRPTALQLTHQNKTIEVCPLCQIIWFDPGDFPGNPAQLEAAFPRPALSPRAREALAIAQTQLIREQADREERRERMRDDFLRGLRPRLFRF